MKRQTELSIDRVFWSFVPPEFVAVIFLPEVPEYPIHAHAIRPLEHEGAPIDRGDTDGGRPPQPRGGARRQGGP